MEPVELDFIYGGNTETEGAKIIKTTEEISAAHKQAKSDIERHQVAIVNLKKDLVELGVSYKRATTKEGKSEILTEIELTKKNIIDETAAIKVLKSEIASMNKMPKTSVMPDANNIAKTAMGYNSLNMSVQQVVRELPAASMGLNMFFLAISNNLPIMADNIKRARLENEALKASGASTTPVWKQLLGAFTSWQSVLMIGITLFSMYGKEMANWVGELISGEKALKKLTAAQMGLTSANQTMIDSLKGGSEFQKAVQSVEQLSTALKNAKGNHELEKKAVDDYNASLGVTFGKVNDVDSALKLINKNKDAYIEAMKAMSFANAFFAKSAEDAYKAMEVGLKNQQQVLREAGTDAQGMWEDLQELDEKINKARKDGLKPDQTISIGGLFDGGGQFTLESAILKRNKLAKEMVKIETEERKRQIDAINKHQNESLKLAKDYYKEYTAIFKGNKFVVDDEKKSANKDKTIFGLSPNQQVEQQLQSIRLGITKDAEKRRTDFMKQSQKAQKLDNDKMMADMKKANTEAERIIQQTGDERTRIEKEYADRIKTLREAGRFDAIAEVEKERDAKISAATRGMIEETDLYKLLSDDKINIARETTQALLEELRKRIEAEVAAGKLSVAAGNKMLSDVGKAQLIAQGDKIQNNPFAQLGAAIGNNTAAQEAFKTAPVGTSTAELAKLESAAASATSSMAGAAGASLAGVKAILESTVGALDRLGLLNEQEKKDAENIIGMVGGAADLAMGIASGNPIQIIQGSIDLLVNGIEYFDFENKKLEKSQREHMKNVDELELKYKKLQRAVETALGTDVYKAQRESIDNQKKQISEYEAWLQLESKKKKRKQDQDKIAETRAKIEELRISIEEEAKAITEAIAQTDAKSLAGELADAITTAFANGEDAALAFGDVAEQVMANAVKNALKLQFLEKPMQNAVDQLAKDMESGGSLSSTEQDSFRKRIEDAGKLYFEQLAQYSDLFTADSTGGGKTGIKGDIAKMTEETGSALVGQITAMRLNVSALLANSKSSLDTVGKVLATLELIKTNTDRLNRIDETLYYIKLNGLKVL